MRIRTIFACLLLALPHSLSSEGPNQSNQKVPLQVTVDHFEVADAVFRDAVSMLSLANIQDLHLGFEEIIRDLKGRLFLSIQSTNTPDCSD